jgi:peptidoglycan/xylan/chitin deacetylase (PgdA/CDA1 family)
MDKRVLRERMRRKKRQMMIRHYTKIGLYVVGLILAVVFVVRGIIVPIAHRVGGGGSSNESIQAQAETEEVQTNSDAAVRQPLKGKSDTDKIATMTAGWHEDTNGKWYQNADGTYFANGFQDIDGVTYSFDENGYIQTGWVTKGVKDYYFNDDGSYDPSQVRPMLALTFDDGPGQYTDELLDCLEENNAHATFFMLGQNVAQYPDAPKRMLELGCEIGSHSWDHTQLTTIDIDAVAKQFSDTDNALIQACGQAATVARAPYGDGNSDIYNTVNKPFFMWSLDTEDWKLLDADGDYNAVMNGDLTDGSIILMHDIHEPSVQAALRLIPDLIAKGYKLVTVSEMAEAKNVTLQNACYVDFWPSTLSNGGVPGYNGGTDADTAESTDSTDSTDGSSSDENPDVSDGSTDDSYDDGSSDDSSYDDGSYDDSYDDYSDDSVDYGDGSE